MQIERSEIPPTVSRAETRRKLRPRPRLLLGPGPSNVDPLVTEALGKPMIGHLDPQFLAIMDELQEMLRKIFMTDNDLTLAVSGTGSAGMEATMVNLVEPGEEVLVCVNGVFGTRMAEIAERIGGVVHRINRPWGEVFHLDEISAALDRFPRTRLVAIVHAETSTGALQPLAGLGQLCRDHDALLVVDAVTSLAGAELRVDEWQIDACYSGTQKCLSCPPGLAPVTVGPRALEKLDRRTTKVVSWYLDFNLIRDYWTRSRRAYHHTAPISMNYALHRALSLVLDEGLEECWRRHQRHSDALVAGLCTLGFEPFAAEGHRLPMLNSMRLPASVDDPATRRRLLEEFDIEVGGGLGELSGAIWRIGLMGASARRSSVLALLAALESIFTEQDDRHRFGAGLEAAAAVYRRREESS